MMVMPPLRVGVLLHQLLRQRVNVLFRQFQRLRDSGRVNGIAVGKEYRFYRGFIIQFIFSDCFAHVVFSPSLSIMRTIAFSPVPSMRMRLPLTSSSVAKKVATNSLLPSHTSKIS